MCNNKIGTEPIAQGTTPSFYFNLPQNMPFSAVTALCIAFAQRGKVLFEKHLEDVSQTAENQFKLTLSQNDTLSMRANDFVEFQVRLKFAANALSSEIYAAKVLQAICKEEL